MDKATAIEKGKNIKLFISDLDGTLLSTDKDLSKNTIRAFQSLSERGIIATICTGRMITVSDFYAFELGVDVPVITANGSCIVDSKTQEVMWDAPMDKNAVTELLDYSRANNIACCVFGSSGKYASTSQDRLDECKAYDEFSIRRGGKAMPQLFIGDDYSEVLSQRIYKSYVFPDASGSFDPVISFLESCDMLDYVRSDPQIIDISPKGITKGVGMINLCGLLGISAEQTCAAGDYDNDVSMLAAAGLSFCMENGTEAAKRAASLIISSNDNDGVADAIYTYLLAD